MLSSTSKPRTQVITVVHVFWLLHADEVVCSIFNFFFKKKNSMSQVQLVCVDNDSANLLRKFALFKGSLFTLA